MLEVRQQKTDHTVFTARTEALTLCCGLADGGCRRWGASRDANLGWILATLCVWCSRMLHQLTLTVELKCARTYQSRDVECMRFVEDARV